MKALIEKRKKVKVADKSAKTAATSELAAQLAINEFTDAVHQKVVEEIKESRDFFPERTAEVKRLFEGVTALPPREG